VRWEVETALGRWRAADCGPAPAEREVGWLLLAGRPPNRGAGRVGIHGRALGFG